MSMLVQDLRYTLTQLRTSRKVGVRQLALSWMPMTLASLGWIFILPGDIC